jgi:Stringent starvation protein B
MSPPASKREVLTAILARGDAFLHLDARHTGVDVPAWLKGDPNLCLQLGYDLPVPIPDLALDEQGVRATLSFRREPFLCIVPWSAVFLIVDAESRGMLWEEDAPPETRVQAPRPATSPPGPGGQVQSKKPARARLRSLPAMEAAELSDVGSNGNGSSSNGNGPHGDDDGNPSPPDPPGPGAPGSGPEDPPRPRPMLKLVK